MHHVLRIAIAVCCLWSCAKTTDHPSGTNTNWMKACGEDSQCDDGSSCLCGVCTHECTETSECGDVHEAASCSPLRAMACGTEHAGASACLATCRIDDDCTALEGGRCVDGICVPAPHASGCFTPEKNQDTVSEPGAFGCPCSHEGDRVCIQGTDKTFACVTRGGATRWNVREGDLCAEPDPETCPSSERDTLEGCLDGADACYQQSTGGGYCGIGMGTSIEPLVLSLVDGTIVPSTAYRYCAEHAECAMVETSCDGCCGQTAINTLLVERYSEEMPGACEGYEGPECDCAHEDLVARCIEGRCTALPREDEEVACYAPGRNEETAYESGSVGCSCTTPGQSICTGPTALFCEHVQWDFHAWISGEDGPCGEPEPDPECGEGELRPTAEACLEAFDTCYRVPGGEYCGR